MKRYVRGNRRKRRDRRARAAAAPVWAFPCLLLAILLLVLGCTGGDAYLENALRFLAQDGSFVTNAVALELGVYPGGGEVPEHKPLITASQEQEECGGEAEVSEEDETAEKMLVSESYFKPPDLRPVSGTPVSPLTIKVSGDGKGYEGADGVYVKNDAKKTIDIASMLKNPKKITVSGDGPQVMLVHTHGSESYTPDGKNYYSPDDNDRTQDKNFNVIRVGDEIEKTLTAMGISVVHCREIFDYPSYNGSYDRSLAAIKAQIKKTPSIKVVIDVHRDAMISKDGTKYKVVSEVGGASCAQLMLVMGTDAGGLSHSGWQTNLNFAANLQKRINGKYPTLMRPINLRAQRFNQHMTAGSMLLEVGTSGNTLGEALLSARVFAQELGNALLGK